MLEKYTYNSSTHQYHPITEGDSGIAVDTYIYDSVARVYIPIVAETIVIGAGIAGLSAANKQAQLGKTAAIFEQRSEFMQGASIRNPGRMGLGYHYADLPTAIFYLNATLAFVKKYKKLGLDFRLGAETIPETHPMRNGRYFVPKNSLVPAAKLADIYSALREEYRRKVKEDPDNEVFGSPDNFYNMLSLDEYKDDINPGNISLAIETREQLLDVPQFREYLISQVTHSDKIKSFVNATVTNIELTPDGEYFIITVKQGEETKKFAAPHLINASWESTDKLNKTLGILMEPPGYNLLLLSETLQTSYSEEELSKISQKHGGVPIAIKSALGNIRLFGKTEVSKWSTTPLNKIAFDNITFPKSGEFKFYKRGAVPVYIREEIADKKAHIPSSFRTNRIKIILEVELPESLKEAPCMFFAIGQFCMFSNMQDGRGYMTFAPETNYVKSNALALTPEEEEKLHTGFTAEEVQRIGQRILDGVAGFIPEMAKAKILSIQGGVVKTYGDVDLCDPTSDVHKRRELGTQELAIGATEISSMKLLYGEENAEEAAKLMETFEEVKERIIKLAEKFALFYVNQQPVTPRALPFRRDEVNGEIIGKTPSAGSSPTEDSYLVKMQRIEDFAQEMGIVKGTASYQMLVDASLAATGASRTNINTLINNENNTLAAAGQDTTAAKILTNYFSVYLKKYSTTKDFKDTANEDNLSSKTKKAIKNKFGLMDEIKAISLDKEYLLPSKIKIN
jgi:hypothetical protein